MYRTPKVSGQVCLSETYKKNKLIYDNCRDLKIPAPKEVENFMNEYGNYTDGEWIDLQLIRYEHSVSQNYLSSPSESIIIEYLNNIGLKEIRIELI